MKYIDELKRENLNGKKVIMRVDFDVPVPKLNLSSGAPPSLAKSQNSSSRISEPFRIQAQKETIDYFIKTVSIGDGAVLTFLAGNQLPGLEALGYYS